MKKQTTKKLRLDTSKVRVLTQVELTDVAGGWTMPPTWVCSKQSSPCTL